MLCVWDHSVVARVVALLKYTLLFANQPHSGYQNVSVACLNCDRIGPLRPTALVQLQMTRSVSPTLHYKL